MQSVACESTCNLLTEVAYYEARGEGDLGMLAVISVVRARALHPSRRWPDNIESVIKQKCEFSYRCDGSMKKPKNPVEWARAREIAWWYLNTYQDVGFTAQYYYRDGISKIPRFSKTEKYVGKVGNHVFFKCVNKYC